MTWAKVMTNTICLPCSHATNRKHIEQWLQNNCSLLASALLLLLSHRRGQFCTQQP